MFSHIERKREEVRGKGREKENENNILKKKRYLFSYFNNLVYFLVVRIGAKAVTSIQPGKMSPGFCLLLGTTLISSGALNKKKKKKTAKAKMNK